MPKDWLGKEIQVGSLCVWAGGTATQYIGRITEFYKSGGTYQANTPKVRAIELGCNYKGGWPWRWRVRKTTAEVARLTVLEAPSPDSFKHDLLLGSKGIQHSGDRGLIYYSPSRREAIWVASSGFDQHNPSNYKHNTPDEITKQLKIFPFVDHARVDYDEPVIFSDEDWEFIGRSGRKVDA